MCSWDLSIYHERSEGLIYDLASPSSTNDREALFIMARQTLNFIDLCGVHCACFVPGAADDQTQRFFTLGRFYRSKQPLDDGFDGFLFWNRVAIIRNNS